MTAGEVISDFIAGQLEGARQRRTNIEARGMSVITSAGVIVTLQLGFLGLGSTGNSRHLPGTAKILIALSLIALLAATAFGIMTNIPEKVREADPSTLRRQIEEPLWSADEALARQAVAANQLDVLHRATAVTFRKGRMLWWAFAAELVGLTLLAAATLVILAR